MRPFRIPESPVALLDEADELNLTVTENIAVAELGADAVQELAEGLVYDLVNEPALCITKQRTFDGVYCLIRDFQALPALAKTHLVDSLCSGLSLLNASASALLEALNREKLAKAFAGISQIDLWQLCSPSNPEEAFLMLWNQTAILLISSASAAKDRAVKEAAFKVLACCALRYKQIEQVLTALTDMLNKDEHMSTVCAELAEYAAKQLGDNQLAVELLREVASVDPSVYEQQQQADAAGVRSVANFIVELSDRLPHVVASNISLLAPHLGGKAYPIRSAIVTAIGHLIQKAFEPSAAGADAQGTTARLRSKQQLLQTLVDRVRDQNAYTRARVLQTWAHLAEKMAVPLGHWVCVTQIAVGRLEDKAAIVRKCALQLLSKLLSFNPFGRYLPLDQMTASLKEYQAKLQVLQPAQIEADPAEWAEGALQPSSQPVDRVGSAPFKGAVEAAADTANSEDAIAAGGSTAGQTEPANDVESMQMDALPRQKGETGNSGIGSNIEQTRALVASLQTAVHFTQVLSESLAVVTQLLASSTMTDVQESITLLIYCHKFQVHGAQAALHKMLPLMFSREQGVKDAVVDAVEELYLKAATGFLDPRQAAMNMVSLAQGSTLGELGALEEVVGQLVIRGLMKPMTLKALWFICSSAHDQLTASGGQSEGLLQEVRSSLAVISMAAMKQPHLVAERLDLLLKVGFSSQHKDALITRQACIALTQLAYMTDRPSHSTMQPVYKALMRTLLSDSLPDSVWYTAAEAAVTAVYALHPAPQELAQAVVHRQGKVALQSQACDGSGTGEAMDTDDASHGAVPAEASSAVSASRLSRLFFILGQVAIQHLLYVERLAKAVRKKRADAEKAAAEAQHGMGLKQAAAQGHDSEDEDIAAQLGVGSLAADVELDALKDTAEGEIVGMKSLLGRYAPLLAALCHNRALLGAHVHLRSSALLALTKLMAIDPSFCDANLALVFTLLEKRLVEPAVRSNLVIALGDLASRFPNLLEPWTERIYGPLSDPDTSVRKNSLMVLTHLIMNDMMKVKGHIARMALCLQDPHPRIKDLAHLFFHELAQKNYKGTSPIYNLLPDMLSSLSSEASLPPEHFQAIMRHLLTFIAKEKQVDSLVEKLCLRFAATQDHKQWRNIAFCLGQLSIGEKGFRKLADLFRCYKDSLADPDILAFFQGCTAKAKKLPKLSPETKADIEAFEGKLEAAAAERREEQATAKAALQHACASEDMVTHTGMEQDSGQDDAASNRDSSELSAESGAAELSSVTAAAAAASPDAAMPADEIEEEGEADCGEVGVEQQLQHMALQPPTDAEHEDPDDAMSSKENRPASGNMHSTSAQPRLSSVESSKVTGCTSAAASSKTRRSARLSGSSSSSATQHSPGPGASQEPATQDSAAPDSVAQASAIQSRVSEQEAAVTPVKAQQAKPADDLDKLLGSRLKPVRPQVELRPSEETAASPVAALRGQLRRVKLEPDEAGSASARQGEVQGIGGPADSPAQAAPAVQLRRVKHEPEEHFSPSSQADSVQGKAHANKSGVSALKGFWETQSTAKLRR
ncbi:hypothetical protein WJX79_009421 [Trebouxia sp. C0005]